MDNEKLPLFLDYDGFREHIADWSNQKIYRAIIHDGLPAIKTERARYLVITKEALLWFKRREVKAG